MYVCRAGRAAQTLLFLANGTLEEENNWLVVKGKTQPFAPLICSKHKIISTMKTGPSPLCPKRSCAGLIEFDI